MTLMPGVKALRYDLHDSEPAAPHRPVLPVSLARQWSGDCSMLESGLQPEPPQVSVANAPRTDQLSAVIASLALHILLAAAFIGFSSPAGMVDVPSEAISVEILPSAVFETMTQSPAEEAAASPSALGLAAQIAKARPIPAEPLPQPPELRETVEIARPQEATPLPQSPERDETVEPERPVAIGPQIARERPTDALQPQQASQEPLAAANLPPPDEEAVTLPSGRDEAAKAANEPALAPQLRPADALPKIKLETTPHRKLFQRKTARRREAASAGSAGARGAEGRLASEGRISASRGSAITYAGIVRARIAANRPGSASARGSVTVDFAVSETGTLTFVRAGGPGELARSVEAAVRRAAPFPAPPPGAPRRFRMTFTFR